ncbi:MAG: DUF4412 domain-containing protein [Thermoanaerobaculia bacterium]|nr:DUF4412 domain-containing protein [Thermoanaerobaculia bacterium]
MKTGPNEARKTKVGLPGLIPIFTLCLTAPVLADTMVEYQTEFRSFEGARLRSQLDSKTFGWIAADRARLDRTEKSVIFRADERKMYFLDHKTKTWQQLAVPVKLEDHFVGERKAMLAEMLAEHAGPVEVEESPEPEKIGSWVTRKLEISGKTATLGSRETVEVWNTTELKLHRSPYDELRRNLAALNPSARRWTEHALAFDGFTVKQTVSIEDVRRRTQVTNQLVAVAERDPPEGHYSPPADYREVPFDVSQYVQILTAPRP